MGDIFRLAAILLMLVSAPIASSAQQNIDPSELRHWKLVWSDEFNQKDGSPPDPAKWTFDTGGYGFGNQELEYYTSRHENVFIEGGNLVIRANKEEYTGADGVNRQYTSARLKTQGRFAHKYGRFEARMKIPYGHGLWPAFWMLGDNIDRVNWPNCGEIDIMENIGKEPAIIHGSIHGPGYSGSDGLEARYTLPAGQTFAADFHVFAVEWEPRAIRFYMDDHLYVTRTPSSIPHGRKWVFKRPFFLLLNVAVGGDWPGSPDTTTTFPQTMLVDYVRVYRR
ncbi:MAG TPA: glycoside hydrolase family 16 protein [Terriglobales bacterium]|nr:glycoside hydrolase family 16 protein [Terriglobales bacterium]